MSPNIILANNVYILHCDILSCVPLFPPQVNTVFLVLAMVKILRYKAMFFRRRAMQRPDVYAEELNLTLGAVIVK